MKKQILILMMALFYSNLIQPAQEAVSSASAPASSSSVSSNPKPKLDTLLIANELEIDKLFEKYKKPIVVKGVSKINKIQLTKDTLNHVFGMSIKQKSGALKDLNLSGFHHDYNLELAGLVKPYYISGHGAGAGVSEKFIAYKRNQFPVFKTFFSPILTREQVIEKLIESLHNIQEYEDQGKNIRIRGKASVIRGKNNDVESIIIDTVVNKQTNDIITFFPVTQKPKEEIQREQQELNLLFKKFHFNLENKPERQSITEEEINQLLSLYADGIEVNWIIIRDNLLFQEKFSKEVLAHLNPLYNKTPKHIKKINITAKTLENVFKDVDVAFPKYLSRVEILAKLKEALQNITIYETGLGDSIREKSVNLRAFKGIGNFLQLRSSTKGRSQKDIWNFYIIINEDTGDLEVFYPLFS